MTTPTRLAEIAGRQAEQQAFETWAREASPFPDGIDGRLYARAGFKAGWSAQLTAAQARSREDAEIMRESAERHHRDSVDLVDWCTYACDICNAAGEAESIDKFPHTPDCLVSRLRARADELEGRTDG